MNGSWRLLKFLEKILVGRILSYPLWQVGGDAPRDVRVKRGAPRDRKKQEGAQLE